MKQNDGRIIRKNQSKLKLVLAINEFVKRHGITSSRQYQKKPSENPNSAPDMWFINKKYGSWENLLIGVGRENTGYGKWTGISEQELLEIVETFIRCEKITSQRVYKQKSVRRNIPSLSTIKKMLGNIHPLFKEENDGSRFTGFELLLELKNEITQLKLQDDLLMTRFRKLVQSPGLPSVDIIMKRTDKNWEGLMAEIGFDYQRVKIYKRRNNLFKTKKTK